MGTAIMMAEVVREFLWRQDAIEYAAKKGGRVSYDEVEKVWRVKVQKIPDAPKWDPAANEW